MKTSKAKTQAQIKKMVKDTEDKLKEDEMYAVRARTVLRPEIVAYRRGAIWALEWALGKYE